MGEFFHRPRKSSETLVAKLSPEQGKGRLLAAQSSGGFQSWGSLALGGNITSS